MFFKRNTISYAVLSLLIGTSAASASGFNLSESSLTALSRSFAGAGIVGDDLSAIAYNPAGMSLLKGGHIQAGGTFTMIDARATGTATPPGTSGSTTFNPGVWIPNFFATYQINDKLTIGAGIFATYGFDVEYDDNWFGKAHALGSKLEAANFNPSASYKITDNLTFGGGVSVERGTARLSSQAGPYLVKLKADDYTYGWNAGLMYEFNKNTRVGASYRSHMNHRLEGNVKSGFPAIPYGDIYTNLDLPEYAIFSLYHKFNDTWAVSGTAKWVRWSRFKTLNIKYETGGSVGQPVEENWEDVWYFSVGADYKLNDQWTFHFGAGLDDTPIPDAQHRTARIPDSNRILVSFGASYRFSDAITIDGGYMHVFLNDMHMNHTTSGVTLDAKYKAQMNLIGVQMQYAF